MASQRNYDRMWWADIVLAAVAALCNLPIREEKVVPTLAVALGVLLLFW